MGEIDPSLQLERTILPLISMCNVACGGHAGNMHTMRGVCSIAKDNYIAVGAHPSYPDKLNFGRKKLDLSTKKLSDSLERQVGTLMEICIQEKIKLNHIKPHGALYHYVNQEEKGALLMMDLILKIDKSLPIVGFPNSIFTNLASKENFVILTEGFGDRRYTSEGKLVNRTENGAVITDDKIICKQVESMVKHNYIKSITNTVIAMKVDTICMHSDTVNAATNISILHNYLEERNIYVTKII